MDIHKPKAAHSLREFAVEIGTIICGVLIALALEQATEAAHRQTEVRDAREALENEIQENVARLRLSIDENACILTQVEGYESWAHRGPKPAPFRYFVPILKTSTWDTVKVGAVPHMPLKERLAMASFYDQLANQVTNRQLEVEVHLAIVNYERAQTLSPDQRTRLLELLSRERRVTHNVDGNASFLIDLGLGLTGPAASRAPLIPRVRSGVAWVCGRNGDDPFVNRHGGAGELVQGSDSPSP